MGEEITEAVALASANVVSLPTSEPHEMRITDHGKIHSFVSFALKFLQENPQRPLVLHTLPLAKERSLLRKNANPQQEVTSLPEPDTVEEKSDEEPHIKKRKIPRPTATIPRLVSVIEIIKREYGKWASVRQAPDGGPPDDSLRLGLHQYNELATLEELGFVERLEQQERIPDETEQLRKALLEGKIFLKQKFTPHLKVTLSVNTQPMLKARGATHQHPPPIKKSKSARARERRRQKKKEARAV